MSVTLLSQSSAAEPAPAGTGPIAAFPGSNSIRVVQINPGPNAPVTGTLEIRGTNKPSPGAGDFSVLATVDLTGRQPGNPFTLYLQTNATSIQIGLTQITSGSVAVFGDSNNAGLVGDSGTTLAQATAVVTSQLKVTVVGTFVHIAAPVVPSITSDDVTYALNFNETVTDVLERLDVFNTTITGAGVTEADLILLAGQAVGGLTAADLTKLSNVDATAANLNQTTGATGNFQSQIDALDAGKADGAGVDLTGLTVSAADFNTFFDAAPLVNVSTVNSALAGLSATAGDLNALAGTAGDVAAADFVKLGDITASASEINVLNGVTASASEINILSGLTSTQADLNAIAGLNAAGISTTELAFLSGLSENVQTALNTITPLAGLTSTVSDLNLLSGAASGTGAFSGGAISAAEIARLDGVSSNIQTQLNAKRNTADTIGIGEITGSSISITELNYLSGATSNIQAQIDGIGTGFLPLSGGSMTGALCLADGTVLLPSLCFTNDAGLDTGIYRAAPGFNFTVDGVRVMRFADTEVVFGDGTTGEARIINTGFGEANPQYAYEGDDDTGMFWDAMNELGFSVGGAEFLRGDDNGGTSGDPLVTIGGAVASNTEVEIPGIFAGIKELGRATQDAVAGGQTVLYTVPAGRAAIVTGILIRYATATIGGGSQATMRMNIGFQAGVGDEIVDNVNNPTIFDPAGYALNTAGQVLPLGFGDNTFPAISGSSGADYGILTAGQVLETDVTVVSDFTTLTLDIIVLGYEYHV